MKTVGILGLQGGFEAHQRTLARLGVPSIVVKTSEQLRQVDGLVIPGGESTTILKLLKEEGLWDEVTRFAAKKPVFGTCAGAILVANEVSHPEQDSLRLIDCGIIRNGYGRQVDSRVARVEPEIGAAERLGGDAFEGVFIRAPIIRRTGPDVKVLARYQGDPVLIEQGRHMAATFHPELTMDPRVHKLFLEKL